MVRTVNKAVAIVLVVWYVTLSMETVQLAVILDGSVALSIKVKLKPYNSLTHVSSEHARISVLALCFDSNISAQRLEGILTFKIYSLLPVYYKRLLQNYIFKLI